MKKTNYKKPVSILLIIAVFSVVSISAVGLMTKGELSKSILDLFVTKKDNVLLNSNYVRNTDPIATVNGLSVPKNMYMMKKTLNEVMLDYIDEDNTLTKQEKIVQKEKYPTGKESIVKEIAGKLRLIEELQSKGVSVEDSEINEYIEQMNARNKAKVEAGDPTAVQNEKIGQEFFSALGLSQEEYDEMYLKSEIKYALYCEKFARDFTTLDDVNTWGTFEDYMKSLLANAEIVYLDENN